MTDPQRPEQIGAFAAVDRLAGVIIMVFVNVFGLIVVLLARSAEAVRGRPDSAQSSAQPNHASAMPVAALPIVQSHVVVGAEPAASTSPSHSVARAHPVSPPAMAARSARVSATAPVAQRAPNPTRSAAVPADLAAGKKLVGEAKTITGTLVFAGQAWHSAANQRRFTCFTVRVDQHGRGEAEMLGKELEECVADSGALIGQRVEITFLGKLPVQNSNGREVLMNKYAIRVLD